MIHYQSKQLLPTLRETPAEAEALSHRLLLRGGLIRQLASGVYTYMPLGRRVLRKLENIIREELDAAGAQEVSMPVMQPSDLWRQSGRYDDYGPELMRVKDRSNREFALGPTHEEVVTALVHGDVDSYKQLPLTLYQIGTKFRDEKRPRFGLLRGREFVMMDAYSFSEDMKGLDVCYEAMFQAYKAILTRVGLNYLAVEADGGAIGDAGGTHEFMALADIGEDTVVTCSRCNYGANLEKASGRLPGKDSSNAPLIEAVSKNEATNTTSEVNGIADSRQRLHTPGASTIAELCALLGIGPHEIIKTLIYEADGKPIAVLVRGDHEVNETKLQHAVGAAKIELASTDVTEAATEADKGFAGPIGLNIPIYADEAVMAMATAVVGGRERDWHLGGVRPGVDFHPLSVADLRNVQEGEVCPTCSQGKLVFRRGIEVGHVFKLGVKYSLPLGAAFTDRKGRQAHYVMGCYGIGVSRLMAALVEQHGSETGIAWPQQVAPYDVHIVVIAPADGKQWELADKLASALSSRSLEVLVDDRNERPGVKLKDADLIGIPARLIVGRGAAHGTIEWKSNGESRELPWEQAAEEILLRSGNGC
ncbi:proline--tRNA ligase [Paenibacillus sp. CAU 1782]